MSVRLKETNSDAQFEGTFDSKQREAGGDLQGNIRTGASSLEMFRMPTRLKSLVIQEKTIVQEKTVNQTEYHRVLNC